MSTTNHRTEISETILYAKKGVIAYVTLNRPKVLKRSEQENGWRILRRRSRMHRMTTPCSVDPDWSRR